jgi:radical SAM superfamily enzyme
MGEEEAIETTVAVLELLPWDIVVHRMTSDPHPEELVAPLWMLDRQGVRKRLEQAMKEVDFRQGSTTNGHKGCRETLLGKLKSGGVLPQDSEAS